MSNLISVDYVRDNNPTVDFSQYSDATISGMISSASRQVELFIEYDPIVADVTNEESDGLIDSDFNLVVYPRKLPIQSVSAISLVKGQDVITLTIVDGNGNNKFNIPTSKTNILYPNRELAFDSVSIVDSFASLRGDRFFTRISYRAGYTTIPEDMKFATNLYVVDRVMRGINPGGAESIRQGGITIKYPTSSKSTQGDSDNIMDAKSILMHYKRVTR
jgi:hypothetical protein